MGTLQRDAMAVAHDARLGGPRQERSDHDTALVALARALDAQEVERRAAEAVEQFHQSLASG
jgi:hypothetical protein